jgi:hypothetical protein
VVTGLAGASNPTTPPRTGSTPYPRSRSTPAGVGRNPAAA